MLRSKRKKMAFLLAFSALLWTPAPSFAKDNFGFQVAPEFAKNQEKGVRYFNLQGTPGQKQTIYVQIKNTSNEDIKIEIQPTNSTTAKNGGIVYPFGSESDDQSILHDDFKVKEKISVEPLVTVPKNKSLRVPIEVQFPDSNSGTYLGGLIFARADNLQEVESPTTKEDHVNFSVRNRYAFAIALQMNMPEKQPIDFSFTKAQMNFSGDGTNLLVGHRNESGNILAFDTPVYYEIFNDQKESITKGEVIIGKMAPMNEVNLLIPWETGEIKDGNYSVRVKTTISKKDYEKTIPFSIDRKSINDYVANFDNENNPLLVSEKTPIFFWILGYLLILLIGGLAFYLGKRRKKEETPSAILPTQPVKTDEIEDDTISVDDYLNKKNEE